MDVEEIRHDELTPDEVPDMADEVIERMKFVDELDTSVFEPGHVGKGCGIQLGLKLALQMLGKNTIVVCSDYVADMVKDFNVIPLKNPVKGAAHLSKQTDANVLCFASADDVDLRNADGNFLCIAFKSSHESVWKQAYFNNFNYVATASIGYPEDYLAKLKKAKEVNGLRFIDLFAPSPIALKTKPSDTVLIARTATDVGLQPLFEIDNDFMLTERILAEPVKNYYNLINQKKTDDELSDLQEHVNKNIRLLEKKKFWMVL